MIRKPDRTDKALQGSGRKKDRKASQNTWKPQAPVKDTIVGSTEYPRPLKLPTIQSIRPHRKIGTADNTQSACQSASTSRIRRIDTKVLFTPNTAPSPRIGPTTVTTPRQIFFDLVNMAVFLTAQVLAW